jgi:hypothetical protein
MQKVIKYILILFFGFLWFLGCSKDISKYLFEEKILKDDFRYGDLYRLSYLKNFKETRIKCLNQKPEKKLDLTLYLAGDSYTEKGRIEAEDFVAKDFVRSHVAETTYSLKNDGKKKVLVIETVERHLRERFTTPWNNLKLKSDKPAELPKTFWQKIMDLKIPYDAQMHESAIFGFDFFMKIKEIKAGLMFSLFDKVEDKVSLSPDRKRIFYGIDVKPGISSGFVEINDSEIDLLVRNMNLTYQNYKNMGFDEVFLSIIPNKSSILGQDLGQYNHLVERIESHPNLQVPIVSIFKALKYNDFYLHGDSHWNCNGQQYWLDQVNQKLSAQ